MYSTSVYGLELLVLEGAGGKAWATDHRVWKIDSKWLSDANSFPGLFLYLISKGKALGTRLYQTLNEENKLLVSSGNFEVTAPG